jgi:hypothetical protein
VRGRWQRSGRHRPHWRRVGRAGDGRRGVGGGGGRAAAGSWALLEASCVGRRWLSSGGTMGLVGDELSRPWWGRPRWTRAEQEVVRIGIESVLVIDKWQSCHSRAMS